MKRKIINKIPIIAKTCQLYLSLVLVWMLLEQLIYHEIQSRLVDDLISIPILVIIYLMFDARAKLNVSKQNQFDQKNGQDNETNIPTDNMSDQ